MWIRAGDAPVAPPRPKGAHGKSRKHGRCALLDAELARYIRVPLNASREHSDQTGIHVRAYPPPMELILHPRTGRLGAEVFENEHAGIPPRVQFWIRIPLEPFRYDGEQQVTEVVLETIQLDVDDWHSIENREYRFPVNPTDGGIDGSVYLDHVHNPVGVTLIRFGSFDNDRIAATLKFAIDFTFEGRARLGVQRKTWDVVLGLDIEGLRSAFRTARQRGIIPRPSG